MKRTICIDTSVVVKWGLPNERNRKADLMLQHRMKGSIYLIAPILLPFEANNVIQKCIKQHRMSIQDGEKALNNLLYLIEDFIDLRNSMDIHTKALQIANEMGQPTTYDSSFLALALIENCEMITADEEFVKVCSSKYSKVKSLEDFQ